MITRTTFSRTVLLIGVLGTVAVLVGPVDAHKTPIKPEQLKTYQDAFMEGASGPSPMATQCCVSRPYRLRLGPKSCRIRKIGSWNKARQKLFTG